MRLLICGDIHGDPTFIEYLFTRAINQNVNVIVNVGDFGYWEHEAGGAEFLDMISTLALDNYMPFYWIDGNHENHTLLRSRYGPGGAGHILTPEGFWQIRPELFYIPRGTRWEWSGAQLMGLGGAYSIDKSYRLKQERLTGCKESLWWPQEEITPEELQYALRDPKPLDILLTHDKPRASNPGWGKPELPLTVGNSNKIQQVVAALTPKVLIHGHLHHRYEDHIRTSGTGYTRVIGLDCNSNRSNDSWICLEW